MHALKTNHPIKVAVVDDQSIYRNGVISSLKPYSHLTVVCEAENGKTLLNQLNQINADVILLDMKMPDMNGVEVCKAIKESHPETKVIGLSVYDHQYYISSLFEAGGDGYLLKDVEINEIVHAINYVYQKESNHNKPISLSGLQRSATNKRMAYFSSEQSIPLKTYELKILKLIALGYTTSKIAAKMELSPKTIENYRGILMEKIGAKNIAGLVKYAIKKGIIET